MKNNIKNLSGGVKFLLGVTLVYIMAFFINPLFVRSAILATGKSLLSIFPLLFFVFFIILIINIFLKTEAIKKHLGNDSGVKGWLYAYLGSILVMGPPYVLYPMLKELRKHGMKFSLIALFLNNRNVQPAFVPMMVYYFGAQFTVVVSIYILIFSFLSAVVIGKLTKEA